MKRRRGTGTDDVDDYLVHVPASMRSTLQQLRNTIRRVAPEAEEIVSYRIPAFRLNGMLVYYAAFKDHCSFFVGSSAVLREFVQELKPFSTGRGTLQFTPQRPIPADLVRRIVRARIAENKSRSSLKRPAANHPPKRPQRANPDSRS